MRVKLEEVCKRIYAGGDVPKDRYSEVKTEEYAIPIYANAEKDDGLYGYTDQARENELSITVAARGTIGFTAIRREPFFPVVRLITVVPDTEKVSTRYLYYVLKNCKPRSSGTSIPQLTVPDIKKNSLELYKISEQEIIADQLDKINKIISLREQELSTLDNLIKSRFIEMFGDIKINPFSWNMTTIDSVIYSCEAGWSGKGIQREKKQGEIAVLKISAVTKGYFIPDECKVLDDQNSIKKYVFPEKGDLLFSRANTREMVGATAIITQNYPEYILPDKLWKIRFTDVANVCYMKYVLSSNAIRSIFSAVSTGTSGSMYNVSMEKFRSISIPLPPIELQNQFAAFVAQTDKSKVTCKHRVIFKYFRSNCVA